MTPSPAARRAAEAIMATSDVLDASERDRITAIIDDCFRPMVEAAEGVVKEWDEGWKRLGSGSLESLRTALQDAKERKT